MRNVSGPLPAIAVLVAYLGLTGMDAIIKELTASFHIGQIVALRYLFGALVALPFFVASQPPRISGPILRAGFLRAIFIIVAAGSFFYAISIMPLAEATALAFTAPLFVILFARLLLQEPVPAVAVVSIMLGFAGVVVMLQRELAIMDLSSVSVIGAGFVLIAAICYSLVMVLTRLHSLHAEPGVLVFAQTMIAGLLALPFLILTWREMDWTDTALFFIVGLLGSLCHFALAWAFSSANAARLSPLEYSVLPWAVIFGFVFFDEIPRPETLVGGVMIVGACLLVLWRQNRIAEA